MLTYWEPWPGNMNAVVPSLISRAQVESSWDLALDGLHGVSKIWQTSARRWLNALRPT